MYYKMAKNGQLDIDANLQEQMEKWGGNYFSAEAMGAEAGRTRQAVERHGSESVMMLQARQPIFQNALPASVSQAYVMADEARMVLGADPEQTAGAVHPFKMVLNQGDYDGDAEWRGTVDLPALSGALREHVAPQTARQIKNIYDALEGGDSLASMGLDASSMREQDGRISFRADRSSQTFGNSAFADSFAFSGDMQDQFGSDASGRADVAVQKSVVGTFGSFQKRSVLFAQFQGTFGNIAQMMRQQMDDPNFNAFTSDEMAEAGRIARKMERLRRQSTGVFGDAFQNLALAEAGITQDAAIEKYKGGDAARSAEDALRLMRGLYDRGGIEADATVGKVISMSEEGHSLMSHYKRAMGGDMDVAREALETRSAAIQLVDRVMNRTGMSSSYLRTYTNARTSEQALDSDPYSRSMNVATDGAGAAVDAAERAILDISQHARQASEVVSELNQMTIDAGMVGAESKGSVRQMLSGLPGGAKIGAVIGGVGALLLSSGRENVAGERGPAYQNGAPTYEAHSRQSTRRLMQARENAYRDVMRAGLQMRDIGRQYAVPPPPTQTRSY
jgi:CTP-dependent riboflavin kinase